jgi:hypothetical protein
MGYEESREKMKSEIGRSTVERIFESLVSDVTDLTAKLALDVIDAAGFIEGLELLVPRLRRFAPGGPASQIAERCETVLMNALSGGDSPDESRRLFLLRLEIARNALLSSYTAGCCYDRRTVPAACRWK